jgi:hypothetical protein
MRLSTKIYAEILLAVGIGALVWIGGSTGVSAQVVEPPYHIDYTVVDLGSVPRMLGPNGGLVFDVDDPNRLWIGGEANGSTGKLHAVGVVRDLDGHITGFAGPPVEVIEAPYIDGGVAYGADGVLFLSRFPNNEIGQVMAGSRVTDKVVDLAALGVVESPGGLGFVPDGFPGAGSLKLASWADGGWYTLSLAADDLGTFDVVAATRETGIPGGPEGFLYIPEGSPQFGPFGHMLVSEWSEGSIAAYEIDDNGDPLPATRTLFVKSVPGAEGAAIDPISGDFLFSTFSGAEDRVIAVRGFAPPPQEPQDPGPGQTCDEPDPRSHDYWRRQCMASPFDDGEAPRQGKGRCGPVPTRSSPRSASASRRARTWRSNPRGPTASPRCAT